MAEIQVCQTPIEGLLVFQVPVPSDARGWFKENWHREKMLALGLPDFGPVQNNVSFNATVGTTRGLHAEPWDKLVSVAAGRVFGAWVDLRDGEGFGQVFTLELNPETVVFVPRGVANGFQTLEPGTAYSYLVNDHWSADSVDGYSFVNLADSELGIDWPIPLTGAVISDKDLVHPALISARKVQPKRVLVIGAGGQVGQALQVEFADDARFEFVSRAEFDLAAAGWESSYSWRDYEFVINAAAYTKVDLAETPEERAAAWAVNAAGVARLAEVCSANGVGLIHISSDYVFVGSADGEYLETDALSPLGVYGASKAAGDLAVSTCARHYILRTSWVIGDGANFVVTMRGMALAGKPVSVVTDQIGRLTFASTIAAAVRHLIEVRPAYGVYNVTNSGEPASWFDVARAVYVECGADVSLVSGTTTAEYAANVLAAGRPFAPRPLNSRLDCAKLRATGLVAADWRSELLRYLEGFQEQRQ